MYRVCAGSFKRFVLWFYEDAHWDLTTAVSLEQKPMHLQQKIKKIKT